MVFNPADLDGLHFVLPCDPAQEWPEPVAECRSDERATFLGAENAMEIGADIGHAGHSAVPSGLMQSGILPGIEMPGYSHEVPPGRIRATSSIVVHDCDVHPKSAEWRVENDPGARLSQPQRSRLIRRPR